VPEADTRDMNVSDDLRPEADTGEFGAGVLRRRPLFLILPTLNTSCPNNVHLNRR